MSGMVFRFFFFVMSFLVLWLQPNDGENYKSFFITFFIFIGSWWIDKIAVSVEGIKAYKLLVKTQKVCNEKENIFSKFKEFKKSCNDRTINAVFVAINVIVMMISVAIGSFLFVLSIIGVMNYVKIVPSSDSTAICIVVDTGECNSENSQEKLVDAYSVQRYLFRGISIDMRKLFWLSWICVVLEFVYLVIYACFSEFYNKLNRSNGDCGV